MPNDQWDRWSERLDHVRDPIHKMHRDRYYWRSLARASQNVEASVEPGSVDYAWLASYGYSYVELQIVRIRAVLETRAGSLTLGRVLHEMAESPGWVTRAAFLRNVTPDFIPSAEQTWRHQYAAEGDAIDPHRPESMLAELFASTERIKAHANKRIAHHDARVILEPERALPSLSFEDVHASIDEIGSAMQWVWLLFRYGHLSLTPLPPAGWSTLFEHLRILPEDESPDWLE